MLSPLAVDETTATRLNIRAIHFVLAPFPRVEENQQTRTSGTAQRVDTIESSAKRSFWNGRYNERRQNGRGGGSQ